MPPGFHSVQKQTAEQRAFPTIVLHELKAILTIIKQRLLDVETAAQHAENTQNMNSHVALELVKNIRTLKKDIRDIKTVLRKAGLWDDDPTP